MKGQLRIWEEPFDDLAAKLYREAQHAEPVPFQIAGVVLLHADGTPLGYGWGLG